MKRKMRRFQASDSKGELNGSPFCLRQRAADAYTQFSMSGENRQERYFRLISGEARGPGAALARCGLALGSVPYRAFMALRRWYYHFAARRVDIPVISVGNLTVGGTGKTPLVVFVARRLSAMGIMPAIIWRGYKHQGSAPGDEAVETKKLLHIDWCGSESPNRVGSLRTYVRLRAEMLEDAPGAAILDDGFQHLRVRRDLDIVTVDATRPFGYGYVLPRGLLREPLSSLRRADAVVITRCDQVSTEVLGDIEETVRRHARAGTPVLHAVHEPLTLKGIEWWDAPVTTLQGRKVYAFCGIGNPDSFYRTLEALGADVVERRTFDDHHNYTVEELENIRAAAQEHEARWIITTMKDLVKLTELGGTSPPADRSRRGPVLAGLVVEMRFREGEAALDDLLQRVVEK